MAYHADVAKAVRISLANKCQLLFGAAVVLILTAALAVVWVRMQVLVAEGHKEAARRLTNAWLAGKIDLTEAAPDFNSTTLIDHLDQGLLLTLIRKDELELAAAQDQSLATAIRQFQSSNDRDEYFDAMPGRPSFRYVRAIRKSDLPRLRNGGPNRLTPTLESPGLADPLEMVLLLQMRAEQAEKQLALNRMYVVAAGLVAGLLAIGVFWFITMRLILSPVRVLRDTAHKISEGDLNIRSDINTGDEFEQMSDTFNHMVQTLKENQDQLGNVNKTLDLKLVELSRSNVALHETNKIKNEFLANVSHELRTPLNSIVGFAEVLEETLRERTGPVDEKRKRYVANIILSSRRLLDLINDLLDLAKIEAGRMDMRIEPMSVADTVEGLVTLMKPQAERRKIEMQVSVQPNLPMVETDAGKFQQVLFNFLANAVKFTPEGGSISIDARLHPPEANVNEPTTRLCVSVTDNGPGIAPEMHDKVFEKFTQLDSAVTKEHGGSGLGLAICRELSRLLQGRIELVSDVGRGATFSLLIPLKYENKPAPLMPNG